MGNQTKDVGIWDIILLSNQPAFGLTHPLFRVEPASVASSAEGVRGHDARILRTDAADAACRAASNAEGWYRQVAYAVGYNDANHFSRLFKQIYGVSPSQYRTDHTPDPTVLPNRFSQNGKFVL